MKLYYIETFLDDCGKYHSVYPGKRLFFTRNSAQEIYDFFTGDCHEVKRIKAGRIGFVEACKECPEDVSNLLSNTLYDIFHPFS